MQSPPVIRLSVRLFPLYLRNRTFASEYRSWPKLAGLEGQGHRSRSWVRLMRSVRPWSRAFFLVHLAQGMTRSGVSTQSCGISVAARSWSSGDHLWYGIDTCITNRGRQMAYHWTQEFTQIRQMKVTINELYSVQYLHKIYSVVNTFSQVASFQWLHYVK